MTYNVFGGRLNLAQSNPIQRTFPILRLTCSWWVTTYMGKPSAAAQPTRPTHPFEVDKLSSKQISDVCSGGAIWWMLTGLWPGAVETIT